MKKPLIDKLIEELDDLLWTSGAFHQGEGGGIDEAIKDVKIEVRKALLEVAKAMVKGHQFKSCSCAFNDPKRFKEITGTEYKD